MGKEDVLKFITKVNKRYQLKFAVLFGSRSRNDHLKTSDYDILLVSDAFTGDIFSRMSSVLELWESKMALEPVCFTVSEFEAKLKTYNAIVWESLKDGKVLFGKEKFEVYRKRFKIAVRNKEIVIARTIKFNVQPEVIFPG